MKSTLSIPKNTRGKYCKSLYHTREMDWEYRHYPMQITADKKKFTKQTRRLSRRAVIALIFFQTLASLAEVLLGRLIGLTLDTGIQNGISSIFFEYVLALVIFLVVSASCYSIIHIWEMSQIVGVQTPVRYQLSKRLHANSYSLSQNIDAGNIVNAFDSDLGAHTWFMRARVNFIVSLLSAAFALYFLFTINWQMALVLLIALPIGLLSVNLLMIPLQKRLHITRTKQGEVTTLANDTVAGLRILRGLGAEEQFHSRYHQKSSEYRDASIRASLLSAIMRWITSVVPTLAIVFVVAWGAFLVHDNTLSAGDLVSFWSLSLYLQNPLREAFFIAFGAADNRVKFPRLLKVFSVPSNVTPGSTPLPAPAQEAALMHLQNQIIFAKGKCSALVSCKKATSNKLALEIGRLDSSNTQGALLYSDGTKLPLNEISNADYYRTITVSPALSQIFAGTLASAVQGREADTFYESDIVQTIEEDLAITNDENVTLLTAKYRDTSHDEQVLQALKAANGQDILDSIGGIESLLDERGRNVSGGQRQRIALARALYANTPFLVLLEPTSALDSATEEVVAKNIAAYRNGKTTIISTASPLLLHECDEVLLVDEQGNLITRGTHHELFTRSELYRQIVNRESNDDTEEVNA